MFCCKLCASSTHNIRGILVKASVVSKIIKRIINNIPAINPFEVLKLRLLEAHLLSNQEKMHT